MPIQFRSLLVEKTEDLFSVDVKELSLDDLHQGDVVIRVAYSSLNYKDALASLPNGKIARVYPLIPGIDFAGTVVSSVIPNLKKGMKLFLPALKLAFPIMGVLVNMHVFLEIGLFPCQKG